jgi:hypothetical protein
LLFLARFIIEEVLTVPEEEEISWHLTRATTTSRTSLGRRQTKRGYCPPAARELVEKSLFGAGEEREREVRRGGRSRGGEQAVSRRGGRRQGVKSRS